MSRTYIQTSQPMITIWEHGLMHGLYGKGQEKPLAILLKFRVMLHISGVTMERLRKHGFLVINPIT